MFFLTRLYCNFCDISICSFPLIERKRSQLSSDAIFLTEVTRIGVWRSSLSTDTHVDRHLSNISKCMLLPATLFNYMLYVVRILELGQCSLFFLGKFYLWADNACHNFHQQSFSIVQRFTHWGIFRYTQH